MPRKLTLEDRLEAVKKHNRILRHAVRYWLTEVKVLETKVNFLSSENERLKAENQTLKQARAS